MYELFAIGEIKQIELKTVICLAADYRKGLKHLDLFSHCIVFYETIDNERKLLEERVVKIEAVSAEEGIVWLSESALCFVGKVFDLKPYFPCEDRVKDSKYCSAGEESHKITLDTEDGQTYQLASIGKVRSQNGKHVIEVDHEGVLESLGDCTHVKIIWWFHRFDQKKYRRITECNPPYENAPRTGVFASRSPVRPNPIAMTTARLLSVDKSQKKIYVSDIECFDQTPCLGILPYNWKEDRMEEVRVPSWLSHWPEWLDDSSDSIISGNIKMRYSDMERILDKKKKSDRSFLQLFSEEAETVPDKTGISIQGGKTK